MSESQAKRTASGEKARPRTLSQKIVRELREWAVTLSIFVPAFFVVSMVAYEQRVIPSESMVPALQVGDRVAVSKFAYGYGRFSVPWGLDRILPLGEGRLLARTPERGDVAVFMHPHYRRVMIKRVIGLPGDTVQMRDEQLVLNGEPVETEFVRRLRYLPHSSDLMKETREYREGINGSSWLAHQWTKGNGADDTPVFVIPEGHVLFIGDNRDNSKDGRHESGHCPTVNGVIARASCPPRPGVSDEDASIGFVPMDHLIGRAETVIFTTHRCRQPAGLDCPAGRMWKGL